MPSPRSVLHDITVNGLNPNKAHSHVNKAGQLSAIPVAAPAPVESEPEAKIEKIEKIVEKKVEKKKPEPKPGLVKLHCEACSSENECGCTCNKCQPKVTKKDVDSAS